VFAAGVGHRAAVAARPLCAPRAQPRSLRTRLAGVARVHADQHGRHKHCRCRGGAGVCAAGGAARPCASRTLPYLPRALLRLRERADVRVGRPKRCVAYTVTPKP
jgi:hypothetical protein